MTPRVASNCSISSAVDAETWTKPSARSIADTRRRSRFSISGRDATRSATRSAASAARRVPQRLLQLIDQLTCPADRIAGLCRAAVDLDEQFVGLPEYLRVDLLHTGADDPHAGDSRQADEDPKDAQRPQGESKQTSASVHEQ